MEEEALLPDRLWWSLVVVNVRVVLLRGRSQAGADSP